MNWQAVATIATLAAVIVALFPILQDAHRRKARARNLRVHLVYKLASLRPSLGRVAQRRQPCNLAILNKDEFRETIRSIGAMMQESWLLYPKEQDRLAVTFINLEAAAALYDTEAFTSDSASTVLALIREAISVMEKHRWLHGPVDVPWEEGTEGQIRSAN